MNCRIIAVDEFKKDAKKLLKKYASLKQELGELQNLLLKNPRMGVLIHENTYKIRLAVKSKGKGKSGGVRIITHVIEVEVQVEDGNTGNDITVFLLAIYNKSDMENISDKELKAIIGEIQSEFGEEE